MAVAVPPFETFYAAHCDEVLAFLRRRVGREHADDVFQDTFLRALRAYDRLEHGEHLRAWVLEPAVGTQRAQERLLEQVVGPVASRAPAQKRVDLALVGFVEPLEGRDAAHRPMKRSRGSRCEMCSSRL